MLLAAPHSVRSLAAALGVCLALAAADAAAKATKSSDKNDAPAAKPALVATYGDWSVFQSQSGKARICYALAQPKERDPADLKRDPGYAFISERPAEGVRNEISFIMGFDVAGPRRPPTQRTRARTRKRTRRSRANRSPRPPSSATRLSTFCPRAPICGSRTPPRRAI